MEEHFERLSFAFVIGGTVGENVSHFATLSSGHHGYEAGMINSFRHSISSMLHAWHNDLTFFICRLGDQGHLRAL